MHYTIDHLTQGQARLNPRPKRRVNGGQNHTGRQPHYCPSPIPPGGSRPVETCFSYLGANRTRHVISLVRSRLPRMTASATIAWPARSFPSSYGSAVRLLTTALQDSRCRT
jgi:hypothetical protein